MDFCGRPILAEIDLSALERNMGNIKAIVGEKQIIAVVKDDAYGHGAKEIVKRIDKYCDFYGVASVEEAVALKRFTKRSFFIFGGIFKGDEKYLTKRMIPTVFDFAGLEQLTSRWKHRLVNLEIDTGMGRTGFQISEVDGLIKRLKKSKKLVPYGLMTHFASSDSDRAFTERQLSLFYDVYRKFRRAGIVPKVVHVANSGGIFYETEDFINAVRPGIMIYGGYPSKALKKRITLEPVMTLKSKIIAIKEVPKGTPISYGSTFVTKKRSLIATIACGYGDGYPRSLSNKGVVYIEGKGIAKVVGRVCMDMTMLDVTDVKGVRVGDVVVLWGRGHEKVHPDNIAQLADTISYELFCRVCHRIPRLYKG